MNNFCYLGSQITPDGSTAADVTKRLNLAWAAFSQLSQFAKSNINAKIKILILTASVFTIASYAFENWNVIQADIHRFDVFYMKCLHIVTETKCGRVSNAEVLRKSDQVETFSQTIWRRQWTYLGHVLRMDSCRYPKILFMAIPDPSWIRPPGGVKFSYERIMKKKAEKLIKLVNVYRRVFLTWVDGSTWADGSTWVTPIPYTRWKRRLN